MAVDVSVQLTYSVTWREISDGLKIQMRHSPVGRWSRRIMWGLGAFLAFAIAATVLTRGIGAVDTSTWSAFLVTCLLLAGVRRLAALRLLSYARHLGEHCVTVDASGIRTVTGRHTQETCWQFYGRCVEGRRVFVLLTPDVSRAGIMILPKGGLASPQDSDRLRELIAGRLAPVPAA
ncbi:hypothetical protein EDD93_0978 [Streptomyces sp. 840.1]|uniref:YcxB family protein n=1 Tax=Streptomyces sp. 840.1 TaxID=2485152 RepID=UPI000F48957C|nr:YcxB family protein [Streptomyces sp. 840.1]ROQ66570.1 hypothetical protein EDD93_0978 [Streptomyces sp. 840.1]